MNPTPPDDAAAGAPGAPASGHDAPTPSTAQATPAAARPASVHSLQPGTRLHEFELTDHIGEGGFSIVYRAWDHSLERVVALKEYMPGSLATRDQDTRVHVRSSALKSTFDAGLRSFVNESKLLASFDHPSLVKVYRFWEANGTAYMVMPFYEGQTLRDTVQAMPAPPSQAWILEILAPLAEALGYIHARSCYHRDIAPDNILMLADSGRPLLLDFGAARRVITDMSQALTVIVKAGYAPIEQYAEVDGMSQGAWTDVHALAAVIYWMVTGKKPPAAISRMLKDTYVPLTEQAPPGYSIEFLRAVDRGLALLPQNRTRSVEAFVEEIGLQRDSSGRTTIFHVRAPAGPPELADARTQTQSHAQTYAQTHAQGHAQGHAVAPTRTHASTQDAEPSSSGRESRAQPQATPFADASPGTAVPSTSDAGVSEATARAEGDGDDEHDEHDEDDDVTVAHPEPPVFSLPPRLAQEAPPPREPRPATAPPLPPQPLPPQPSPSPSPSPSLKRQETASPSREERAAPPPRPTSREVASVARTPAPIPRLAIEDDAARHAVARRTPPRALIAGIATAAVAAVVGIAFMLRAPTPTPAMTSTSTSTSAPLPTPPSTPTPAPTPTPAAVPTTIVPTTAATPAPQSTSAIPAASEPALASIVAAPEPQASPVDASPAVASTPGRSKPPAAPRKTLVASPPQAPVRDANAAECARVLQRLSLGETAPELIERAGNLHCK